MIYQLIETGILLEYLQWRGSYTPEFYSNLDMYAMCEDSTGPSQCCHFSWDFRNEGIFIESLQSIYNLKSL